MRKLSILVLTLFIVQIEFSQTISDVDDNAYNIVTVEVQMRLKENLMTAKFNNGTSI